MSIKKDIDSHINCWEYMKCGREVNGQNVEELGVCPVLKSEALNIVHNGKFAGRCCWIVAGTLCSGEVQGSQATKLDTCRSCDFYKTSKKNKKKEKTKKIDLNF